MLAKQKRENKSLKSSAIAALGVVESMDFYLNVWVPVRSCITLNSWQPVLALFSFHCFLAPVVKKLDSAIQWINLYPVDNAIGFPNTYPLIAIYSVDSAIQVLNIRGLYYKICWFYSSAALSTRLEQSFSRWYFFCCHCLCSGLTPSVNWLLRGL